MSDDQLGPAGPPPVDPPLADAVMAWIDADPDEATRSELRHLLAVGDTVALADRFSSRLTFGTSGIRGHLGAGPNRMNRLVVRQVAAGLARWLPSGATVVVGRDARHGSEEFADDAARVLASAGVHVVVFAAPQPTPVVSFAVREIGADAGIMVTASHNPAGDNGLKVFDASGAQLVTPHDDAVMVAVEQVVAGGGTPPLAESTDERIRPAPPEVTDAYLESVTAVLDPNAARQARIVYTALHGVGGRLAVAAFARAGFTSFTALASQFEPDPDFPTTPRPNPEEPGALDLALEAARDATADLVLAHDPDADRLGVAVRDRDGTWRVLTGDEVGALLADHLLRSTATAGADRLVVTSIVSSPLVGCIAAAHGVHHIETLTGFKWIMQAVLAHPEWRFVAAYEESLGYAVTSAVPDKDGISAALVMAEIASACQAEDRSLLDRLDDLARAHGVHATRRWNWRDDEPGGFERLREAMGRLRGTGPDRIAGRGVVAVSDFLVGRDGRPGTDALRFDLDDGTRVMVRPSGTEPTLKVYLAVTEPVPDTGLDPALRAAEARLDAVLEGVRILVGDAVVSP